MNTDETQIKAKKRIRLLLIIFIVGLAFSGATAIPLESEIKFLTQIQNQIGISEKSGVCVWLAKIRNALVETNTKFPFMAYGTDWLAFAHFVIAIAFLGPLRDPVKNIWVIEFGIIACALVVPFALCMGAVRGIPIGWRLIDCFFGILGIIPLWLCHRKIKQIVTTKISDI
jgi:hypothetical protein